MGSKVRSKGLVERVVIVECLSDLDVQLYDLIVVLRV